MIKAISASPIRKTTMALLVTAPFIFGACKSGNNNSVQQNQTEVVSKAGSDALKTLSDADIRKISQSLYSFDKNVKLEKKLRSLYNNSDLQYAEKAISNANEFGTFNSAIQIQFLINDRCFSKMLVNYGKGFNEKNIINNQNDKSLSWSVDEVHLTAINKLLSESKIASRGCSEFCDDYLKSFDFVTEKDLADYEKSVNNFISKQDSLGTPRQMADLISYKIFKADSIIFKRYLEQFPIYNKTTDSGEFKTFDEYFQKYFVNIARPEP